MFCFDLTVSAACAVGTDLSVTINTTGDGESGSWSSVACADDDASILPAYMICCDPPLFTTVDETCPGDGDGSATVTGQGGTAIIQPQNTNSLLGVPRGAGADFAPNSINVANSIYGPEESRQRTMNKII